jgi:RNA polymerase sigma-70 factor, ECF subfamily
VWRSSDDRASYATTGSLAEAEDCVQEAWPRLQRAQEREPVRELGAWLTTTVSRLVLDALDRVTLDESVSMALLVVLEALSPAERTAFLLRDVFGLSYEEVADLVGRSEPAVRQLAFRARRRVREDRPRFPPTRQQQRAVLDAFTVACTEGDLEGLRMLKAVVNGESGLVIRDAEDILSVLTLTVDNGRTVAIDVIHDPVKLSRVAALLPGAGDD